MDIDFAKYLPIAPAILSATLGYMLGIRNKKNDRLIQFTQENLKDVFSPMYHELKHIITYSESSKNREMMIDNFFENYNTKNTNIYKLGNLELLDTFYELNDKYVQFKLLRDEELWKEIWWELENKFFYKIEDGYKNSTNLLYRDFRWQQYIQSKPYWMKFYFESMKFLFDTAKGINIICFLMFYFSGCFELLGQKLFPKDFWIFSLVILGLSLMTTLVLLMPNVQYLSMSSNSKQSFSRKVIKKIFPKLLDRWDNFVVGKRNFEKIPKMYEKKSLDL